MSTQSAVSLYGCYALKLATDPSKRRTALEGRYRQFNELETCRSTALSGVWQLSAALPPLNRCSVADSNGRIVDIAIGTENFDAIRRGDKKDCFLARVVFDLLR